MEERKGKREWGFKFNGEIEKRSKVVTDDVISVSFLFLFFCFFLFFVFLYCNGPTRGWPAQTFIFLSSGYPTG